MTKNNEKTKTIWSWGIIILIGILLMSVFSILFYRQAVGFNGRYVSDLPSHIEFGVNGKGYSLLYWTIGGLNVLFGEQILPYAVAVLESLMIFVTGIIAIKIIHKYTKLSLLSSAIAALILTFLTTIYLPGIAETYYKQSLIAQPWHNITYYGMRLFVVIYMYFFLDIYNRYLEKFSFLDWVKLALPLTLSAGVKPNFLLAIGCTMLICMVIDAFRKKWKLKSIRNIVLMGTTFFPSLIVLALQSTVLYGNKNPEKVSGIIISLAASTFFSKGAVVTILKLLRSLLFPTLVFIYNRKENSKVDKFNYFMFFVTLLEILFIHETGYRAAHENFYWGLFISGYILFLYAIPKYFNNIKKIREKKSALSIAYLLVNAVLLIGHFATGIAYFVILMGGKTYTF